MNDFLELDILFSFEQLLYGDDWQRWDIYLSVDVNVNLIEFNYLMVEMNYDGMIIDVILILMIYLMVIIYFLYVFFRDIKVWINNIRFIENVQEEIFEQWLQILVNGLFEILLYEEFNFMYEVW